MVKRKNMSTGFTLLIAAAVLLGAGAWSLLAGKTIGLYGVIEPRGSIFYWIIVTSYLGLGTLCVAGAVRILLFR